MKLLRFLLIGLLAFALVPVGVSASEAKHEAKAEKPSEGKAKDGKKESSEAAPKPKDGLFDSQDNLVPLPTIIAPVLYNERLNCHLYIYAAALTANASDAQEVKMRLPYIQDALVRDVNDNALTVTDPRTNPDTKGMVAHLKAVINAAVGKPLVTDLQVARVDTSPY
jgi:hypothetical protein